MRSCVLSYRSSTARDWRCLRGPFLSLPLIVVPQWIIIWLIFVEVVMGVSMLVLDIFDVYKTLK